MAPNPIKTDIFKENYGHSKSSCKNDFSDLEKIKMIFSSKRVIGSWKLNRTRRIGSEQLRINKIGADRKLSLRPIDWYTKQRHKFYAGMLKNHCENRFWGKNLFDFFKMKINFSTSGKIIFTGGFGTVVTFLTYIRF